MFSNLKAENRAALIGYMPAGFPSREESLRIIDAMIAGGVDAIEVGYPYSDPVMDGPIIQAAAEISLANKTTAADVFDTVSHVAAQNIPVVIMTYWNPIERYGVKRFAEEIIKRGGSGVITPDLTIEESRQWIEATNQVGANRIYVVALSTTQSRLELVTEQCSGFVYAASLMGVTGLRDSVSSGAQNLVDSVRKTTNLPVAVGLGVSTAEQAAKVAEYADGVIVGSAFIRKVQEAGSLEEALENVKKLASELSEGIKFARSPENKI